MAINDLKVINIVPDNERRYICGLDRDVSIKGDDKKAQRRKGARPSEIIDAALIEFAENGFAATRMSDVAARAGVVKGTLYRYFDTKELLFQAAVEARIVSTLGEVEGLVDMFEGSTEELLRLVLTTLYERLVKSDALFLLRIIIAEGRRFPSIPEYYHRVSISKGVRVVERIVARGVARGEFRDGPFSRKAIVLMGPTIFAAVWQMTFAPFEELDLDLYIEAHIDMVLHGLKA